MDLASVAVVRLVVFTSPTQVGQLPKPCSSGVGTIVSSNAQPSGNVLQGPALNYVLTDGSLLACTGTPGAVAVTLYANDAYTNNSSAAFKLAQITCKSDLTACTTTSAPQSSANTTICQNIVCNSGAILLPFTTTDPQPYLTTTSTPVSPTLSYYLGEPFRSSIAVKCKQSTKSASGRPQSAGE